jgi:hypothetical protein
MGTLLDSGLWEPIMMDKVMVVGAEINGLSLGHSIWRAIG